MANNSPSATAQLESPSRSGTSQSESFRLENSGNDSVLDLTRFGINSYTPEIVSTNSIKNLYSEVSGIINLKENSNYDFMIFQTQLDLAIKEIINEKIENNEDLKLDIIENFKDTIKEVFEEKERIKSIILSINNALALLDIQSNLLFDIAVQQEQEPNESGMILASISNDKVDLIQKKLNVDWKDNSSNAKLTSLIGYASQDISSSATKDNELYDNICEYVVRSLFGVPTSEGFEYESIKFISGTQLKNDLIVPDEGILNSVDAGCLSAALSILSRAKYYNAGMSRAFGNLKDIGGVGSLVTSYDYRAILNYALSTVGDKSTKAAGSSKLIDYSTIITSDSETVDVFNKSIETPSSSGNRRMTGTTYFREDIVGNLVQASTESSLKTLFEEVKQKTTLTKSVLSEILSAGETFANANVTINPLNTGNAIYGIIREFATIIYEELSLDGLFSEESEYFMIGNKRVANILSSLSILSPVTDDNIERAAYVYYPDSDIVLYSVLNEAGSVVTVYTPGSTTSASTDGDHLTGIELGTPFRAFAEEDMPEGATMITVQDSDLDDHYFRNDPTNSYLNSYDPFIFLSSIFERINEFIESQEYVGGHFVYKVFDSFCKSIINDFRYEVKYDNNVQHVEYYLSQGVLDTIHLIRSIKEGTLFSGLLSNEIVLGGLSNVQSDSFEYVKNLYRQSFKTFALSHYMIKSLDEYADKIIAGASYTADEISESTIENMGYPSIERVFSLETNTQKLFLPTTSFNTNPSYFSYHNTLTSKDISAINRFSKINPGGLVSEDRVITIGLPAGLVAMLRNDAGVSDTHTIVQIMFYVIDHKKTNSDSRDLGCILPYIFNTCLDVDTRNKDIVFDDIQSLLENNDYSSILNIDDPSNGVNQSLSSSDMFLYTYGRLIDDSFSITRTKDKSKTIEDMARFKTITGNLSYSQRKSIVDNHIVDYALKRHIEVFGGISLNAYNFASKNDGFIKFNEDFIVSSNVGSSVNPIIASILEDDMSDDVKDYLSRTAAYSAILNPDVYVNKALSYSKFDRTFTIPLHKSLEDVITDEFKTFIPIVSIV